MSASKNVSANTDTDTDGYQLVPEPRPPGVRGRDGNLYRNAACASENASATRDLQTIQHILRTAFPREPRPALVLVTSPAIQYTVFELPRH